MELGKRSRSLALIRRAKQIAGVWGFDDIKRMALGHEARVCHEMNRLCDVKAACDELLKLSADDASLDWRMCALHGLAIVHLLEGRVVAGSRCLSQALREAQQAENRHWTTRCLVDRCRPVGDADLGAPDVRKLRRAASRQETKKQFAVAGDLWLQLGNQLKTDEGLSAANVYRQAARCYEAAGEFEDAVMALVRCGTATSVASRLTTH